MKETKEIAKKEETHVQESNVLRSATPLVDIYENDNEIIVHAEMPGVNKKDIDVNIDNGILTISGVRRIENKGSGAWQEFGDIRFLRKFSIPQAIDTERVEAQLKDGLLKLHLPKSEAAKPKAIEIKAA